MRVAFVVNEITTVKGQLIFTQAAKAFNDEIDEVAKLGAQRDCLKVAAVFPFLLWR